MQKSNTKRNIRNEIYKKVIKTSSIAIMIDQGYEGIKVIFEKRLNYNNTSSICKKFNCKIIPIYIERLENNDFKLNLLNL